MTNVRHEDEWVQCLHALDQDEKETRGQKRCVTRDLHYWWFSEDARPFTDLRDGDQILAFQRDRPNGILPVCLHTLLSRKTGFPGSSLRHQGLNPTAPCTPHTHEPTPQRINANTQRSRDCRHLLDVRTIVVVAPRFRHQAILIARYFNVLDVVGKVLYLNSTLSTLHLLQKRTYARSGHQSLID